MLVSWGNSMRETVYSKRRRKGREKERERGERRKRREGREGGEREIDVASYYSVASFPGSGAWARMRAWERGQL